MFFSVQCCLEPLGQHWTRTFLVQCSTKSIKTTLNSIFSCATLFGASWITFHKDFTYAMLSQEYWNNIEQFFFLCNVVWNLLGNTVQEFYLCNIVPTVLRQHWTGLFLVECCVEPLGKHLHKDFNCAMLS